MYKIERFESENCITAEDCLKQLADYLNTLGGDNIAIADIEKSWKCGFTGQMLTAVILLHVFEEVLELDHCKCGMAIDVDWEYCPKCRARIVR